MTTPQDIEQIVEEFGKEFGSIHANRPMPSGLNTETMIKSFIRTTLKTYGAAREAKGREEERGRLLQKIRDWKLARFTEHEDQTIAYRQATIADDLLIALTPPSQTDIRK